MRWFVAFGIVLGTLLALTAKAARHHRRVLPPPNVEDAEVGAETPAPRSERRSSAPARRAWSGPTLGDLLEEAAEPVTIRGHARGPEGAAIGVRASPAGRPERGRRIPVEDGEFEIPGLVSGRRYDLTFEGTDLRSTTLRSVTAPADDVEALLEPLPILRGAIGFPPGRACPYDRVALGPAGPQEDASSVNLVGLDDDCRFELPVPDGPTRMVLVAIGDGPHLELPISVPPTGDPDPVCLNPPCLPVQPRETARLRVSFAGADHSDLSTTLVLGEGDRASTYLCGTNGGTCELEALPASKSLKLVADASDCATATETIVLRAGDNEVSLPCEPKTSAVVKDLEETEPQKTETPEVEIQDEVVLD